MRWTWTVLAALAVLAAGCIGADDGGEAGQAGLEDAGGTADELADLPPVRETVERVVQVSDRWSGEPSILALDDGTLLITGVGGFSRYVEDPTDAPGNFGQSYIWRSTDDGRSWALVDVETPGPTDEYTPYRNAVPGVEGDLARDESGRVYFVDLSMLATNGVSASDDAGETWTAGQSAAGLPATDRPWIEGAAGDEVYVKYLHFPTGWRVARSIDGGTTFPLDRSIPSCSQADLAIDRAAGHLLIPCAGTEANESLSILRTPTGQTMDWEHVDVPDADGPVGHIFPALAVAGEGEYVYAYALEAGDGETTEVRVRTTVDAGKTWSDPVTLSSPDGGAVFPWVAANDDGTVAVVWYETPQAGLPSEHGDDARWFPTHARFQVGPDGAAAENATVTRITEEPNHEGAICTGGLGCVLEGRSDERRLLDFFEVDVDEDGVSHVTWTDTGADVPTVWYGQVAEGEATVQPVDG